VKSAAAESAWEVNQLPRAEAGSAAETGTRWARADGGALLFRGKRNKKEEDKEKKNSNRISSSNATLPKMKRTQPEPKSPVGRGGLAQIQAAADRR
jgi:hypothetical protein